MRNQHDEKLLITKKGFFQFHGIWAPGIRLFRNLNFREKAVMISMTFMLPIIFLGWFFLSNVSDSVEFSAKERVGIRYTRQVVALLSLAQTQRALEMRALMSQSDTAELAAAQRAFEEQLARVSTLDTELGTELGTSKLLAQVQSLAKAMNTAAGQSAKAIMKSHAELTDALLNLITSAGDGSNLTLDPDVDTYYLMDTALTSLPTLMEMNGRVHAAARLLASTQPAGSVPTAPSEPATLDLAHMREIAMAEAISGYVGDKLHDAINKVIEQHPQMQDALSDSAIAAMMKSTFVMTGGLLTANASPKPSMEALDQAATRTLGAIKTLQSTTLNQLDKLISERIAHFEQRRNIAITLVMTCLLASLYAFVSFSSVLAGGLRGISHHVNAIAAGDLSTRANAWGRDEAGAVLHQIRAMQTSLSSTVTQMRDFANGVASSSAEVASGTLDLSQRTEEAAANLEKNASAMEQMRSSLKQTAQSSEQALALADQNAQIASHGGSVINDVVTTMEEIQLSSRRIADIIGVIDGIAFQTNILALNAAVESARAGEQGRGFAVVAGEVRTLAHRSAAAAREIKSLISTSTERTENGMRVVQQAGQTMDEIVKTAKLMNQLLGEVANATREQTAGIEDVTHSVSALDTLTQQNAALVEQTSGAASSMSLQAQQLATEVARFRLRN